MVEEELAASLPEDWDLVETNVVYSHPLPSNNFPRGVMYSSQNSCTGPLGEKDILLYNSEPNSMGRIGYIEVKSSEGARDDARTQLKRAQEHWNTRGYEFIGGFSTGDLVYPWDGEEIEDDGVRPENFDPSSAESIRKISLEPGDQIARGELAENLVDMGWDEAYENVIYGMPLDHQGLPRGMAGTNEHNTHFGQMDVCAYRENENSGVVGHVESLNKDVDVVEGRLDFSYEFWTDRGFEFQGAAYDNGEFIQRDFDQNDWVEPPTA